MHKLKPIEISMLFGVLFALLWGSGTARAQEDLANSMIRLHVIANSDSAEDQEHKLAVRDAVLTLMAEWSEQTNSVEEMETFILANLTEMETAGEAVLQARGSCDQVTASVTNCYFPTKEYGDFALPAGWYNALCLEIGAGEGENWWCVAFPPLCIGASAESMENAVQAGFFTQEQVKFLAGESESYILKFRSMELLGQLKALFCRG